MKKYIVFLSLLVCFCLCACTAEDIFSVYSEVGSVESVLSSDLDSNILGPFEVTRVIDGDTFVIRKDGEETKIRLIGVDTPESVATGNNSYKNCEEGKIASDFSKGLLTNKTVRLEYDVSVRDAYGRELCYVYLEDGTMLNEILLETGYARLMTIPPNVKYVEKFKEIEKTAQEQNSGFWNLEDSPWVE